MTYEKPRCSQIRNGQPCGYEPIHKCQGCGALICIDHAHAFKSPNTGVEWRQFDGIYCPSCFEAVGAAHDQQAEEANKTLRRQHTTQTACNFAQCGCDCLDSLCKEAMRP